ncbi:arylsulfatase [Mariniflexile sp.]|uniref:arylsulfatase n=3 Tax=Mariniflexile sp. TaxID=1979402 RepID=UPI004047089A
MKRLLYYLIIGMLSVFSAQAQTLKEVNSKPSTQKIISLNSGKKSNGKTDKPNVILIVTDDQGWGDVSFNGNSIIRTPNIDFLAENGASLSHFYVNPSCAPTRSALLTGKYSHKVGAHGVSKGFENLPTEEITIAEILKENGYTTSCFGKWHSGRHFDQHPLRQGFDEFVGFRSGNLINYFDETLEHNNNRNYPTKGYITDVLTDEAISFMKRNIDKPFFCYIPYNAPHSPFQVPDRYFDHYTEKGCNPALASIYGMVENLDENLGRILGFLEQNNLTDNTLIVFLSDNGPGMLDRYNGGMRGRKGSVDEGGLRVPAYFYWKGKILPGTKLNMLTAHIDLLPTLASITKSEIPNSDDLDGIDIMPFITKQRESITREIFTPKQINVDTPIEKMEYSFRTDRYRLVKRRNQIELYDMINDGAQSTDIALEYLEITNELKVKAESCLAKINEKYAQKPLCIIGDMEAKIHELYADEAHFSEGIKFAGLDGFNPDWLTNITSKEDSIWWDLDVKNTKTYTVLLKYACTEDNIGCRINVMSENDKLSYTLNQPYDEGYLSVPNRGKSEANTFSYKKFKTVAIGKLKVSEGTNKITVNVSDIKNGKSIDLKTLILTE